MNSLHLIRRGWFDNGTFGEMEVDGRTMLTVERPWLDNARRISCIPAGTYRLVLDPFRGQYNAPLLLSVPGRSQIQIHIANGSADLLGCIGVGWKYAWYKGTWGIGESRSAFEYLMTRWPFEEITITNYQP